MKQINYFSILFSLILLLLTSSLAAAVFTPEAGEIPYQINNSDHIVIGTVSEVETYDNFANNTITVDEWLYNPLSEKAIIVRTTSWAEDAKFTKNESVLLMLNDKSPISISNESPERGIFYMDFGELGKHPVSDRDAVIKELKAQGKWEKEDQIGNISNSTGNENDIPQLLPLTFGPGTLDKLKNDTDFIAAYGSIPNFSTSEERKQWLDKLNDVYQGSISEMSKYEYPNGPVTSFGYTIDGVLQVGVNKIVEKPFMDEIYKIFDSKASLIGIKEVPVFFVHADIPVPTTSKIEPVVKTANLSISGNKSPSRNESNKNHSVPGVGLLASFICLYVGCKLRKK